VVLFHAARKKFVTSGYYHFFMESVMNEQERLNAIEVALTNETREREFYLKNAQKTRNALGKIMFQLIGDEELEHYERLKELHQKWVQQEKWPETVPLKVKDTVVRDVLKDFLQKMETSPEKDENDLEAVRTAIEFEAKGAMYYKNLQGQVSDIKEKQFFELLANMEREHYLSLKDTEEYLTDSVSWFRKQEHHSLDGA
jgi:rubrerythrin